MVRYSREFKPNDYHTFQVNFDYDNDRVEIQVEDSRNFDIYENVVTLREYYQLLSLFSSNDNPLVIKKLNDLKVNQLEKKKAA